MIGVNFAGALSSDRQAAATSSTPTPPPIPTTGLVLWLKGDTGTYQQSNGTVPAVADGDVVGFWADQSGTNNNVTQSTTATKGTLKVAQINGVNTVDFSTSLQKLVLTSVLNLGAANDFEFFLVGKFGTNGQTWVGLSSTADNSFFNYFNTDGVYCTDSVNAFQGLGTGSPATGTLLAARGRKTASAYGWKVNGGGELTAFNPIIGTLAINCVGIGLDHSGGGGSLGEVIVYSRALTGAERTQIGTYLLGRWGLQP